MAAAQSLQEVDDQAVAQSSGDNQGSEDQDMEAVPSLYDDRWVPLVTEDHSDRESDVDEEPVSDDEDEDEYLPHSHTLEVNGCVRRVLPHKGSLFQQQFSHTT